MHGGTNSKATKKHKLQNRHQVELIQLCHQAGFVLPVVKDDDQTLAFYAAVSTVSDNLDGTTTVVVTVKDSPNINPCKISQKVPFTLTANELFFCMTSVFSHPDHLVSTEHVAEIRALNEKRPRSWPLEEPRKILGKMKYYIHLNGPQTQLFHQLVVGELKHLPLPIIPVILNYMFTDHEQPEQLFWEPVKQPKRNVDKWY